MTQNIYKIVTDKFIAELSKGIIPWHKPWGGTMDGAISYTTGKPYSLLNQMLLGRDGEFLTFKQIADLGGKVKKGAKASMVVFSKQVPYEKEVIDENGEKKMERHTYPVLRYYNVFHISDCEGIESKVKEVKRDNNPIESAEKVITHYFTREACKLNVRKSNRAYYSPTTDEVVVPLLEQFESSEEYYGTLFHEECHSTGHKSRLDRHLEDGHFGNEPYAKEELIAELGSAFLAHKCGLDCDKTFKNSTAYIQSWLQALKNDERMIVSASSHAQKAVEFILA